MTSLLRALGGLAAVGAAGVGYASLVERNAFTLRRCHGVRYSAGFFSVGAK